MGSEHWGDKSVQDNKLEQRKNVELGTHCLEFSGEQFVPSIQTVPPSLITVQLFMLMGTIFRTNFI